MARTMQTARKTFGGKSPRTNPARFHQQDQQSCVSQKKDDIDESKREVKVEKPYRYRPKTEVLKKIRR